MKKIKILAIESSCDETSMAIIENGTKLLSLTILTQMDTHASYGGVVPEIASRMHTENITMVLEETLRKANMQIEDVDAIAVTYAPGLMGSLLIGVECAKSIAMITGKPLIKVNHIIGHIYANNINNKMEFPLLALVVSGGHSDLVIMERDYEFKTIGKTLDDAVGECFDKVARICDLPYPGGPNVEKMAQKGHCSYELSIPKTDNPFDFSYSGLKSQVINLVHNKKQKGEEISKEDLACSFQTIAVKQITTKLEKALKHYSFKNVILAGGVSANGYLRNEIKKVTEKYDVSLSVPPINLCTDNAAMIGAAAYPLYLKKEFADFNFNPESHTATF